MTELEALEYTSNRKVEHCRTAKNKVAQSRNNAFVLGPTFTAKGREKLNKGEGGNSMKRHSFESATAPVLSAIGGALVINGHGVVGGIAIVFSYLWGTGFFTDMLGDKPETKVREDHPEPPLLKYQFRKGLKS